MPYFQVPKQHPVKGNWELVRKTEKMIKEEIDNRIRLRLNLKEGGGVEGAKVKDKHRVHLRQCTHQEEFLEWRQKKVF